ncbi:hypothetical protein JRO89_XS04G0194800 [Xanthoceras sorbifolium]|uniref:Uncharacterized protein n=1 Tax=Xanthoceras sorbifolium TaxID=99658 RepID=A0ABQ8I5Z3_9ROSI|nr:hypothetical protein JRO89_XS04G0194800 [Xanthoceras sorbifolium]
MVGTQKYNIVLETRSQRKKGIISLTATDSFESAAGDDRSLITMVTTESIAEEDTIQAAVGVQASKSITVAKVGRVIEIEGIALHDVEVMGECQSIASLKALGKRPIEVDSTELVNRLKREKMDSDTMVEIRADGNSSCLNSGLEKNHSYAGALKEWNTEKRKDLRSSINRLRKELYLANTTASAGSWSSIHRLEKQLDDLLSQEKSYWRQRSRVGWLKDGDSNTRFFHQHATTRKRKNGLAGFVDNSGPSTSDIEAVFKAVQQCVSPSMNALLERRFDAQEIAITWSKSILVQFSASRYSGVKPPRLACARLKTKLALGVVIRNGSGEVMLSASRTIDMGL